MIHSKMFEKISPKKLVVCTRTKSNNKILLNLELDIDSSTTLTIDTIDTGWKHILDQVVQVSLKDNIVFL